MFCWWNKKKSGRFFGKTFVTFVKDLLPWEAQVMTTQHYRSTQL